MFDEEFCASEDSVAMNCDPCQFEGTQTDARAFCQECNEFLCQQCLQSHRKFQAFRHHNILRGDSMPRTREETTSKLALKFCDDHRMNEVQFYCSTHKSVLCSLCKMAKHSTCDCKLIEDICGKDDQAKFHNIVKEIEVIKMEYEQLKSVQIEVIDSTTANSKMQRAQLHSVRKEMNEYFDELENEITKGEIQEKSDIKGLRENVAMYTDVINNLTSLQDHTDHVSKSNDKVAVFAATAKLEKVHGEYTTVKNAITLKPKTRKSQKVMKKILTVKEMYETIKRKMNMKTFDAGNVETEEVKIFDQKSADKEGFRKTGFKMNENGDDQTQCSDNSNVASYSEKVRKTKMDEPLENEDFLEEKQKQSQDDNIKKKPGSQKPCYLLPMSFENLRIKNIFHNKAINFGMTDSLYDVTSSLFLPDGSLVLCDHAKLILLSKEFQMLHQLEFEGNLWDVALVNENEVIVTLKSQKLLKYIKVESGRLHEGKGINLKRVPWGVAVYKDTILTTFHNNPGKGFIEVRDRHGKIKRNITVIDHGKELFVSPFYITVDQHNGDIYVSDGRNHCVTCLSFEGKLLYKMEGEEFKWPRKLILDNQGNCLLCASFANKILLIKNKSKSPLQSKAEATEYKVLLKCNRPQTVSMRWEDQTMIVGLNKTNLMLALT